LLIINFPLLSFTIFEFGQVWLTLVGYNWYVLLQLSVIYHVWLWLSGGLLLSLVDYWPWLTILYNPWSSLTIFTMLDYSHTWISSLLTLLISNMNEFPKPRVTWKWWEFPKPTVIYSVAREKHVDFQIISLFVHPIKYSKFLFVHALPNGYQSWHCEREDKI